MKRRDAGSKVESSRQTLRIGVVSTSFPVASNPSSGVFVQRLLHYLPDEMLATVLIPCPPSDTARNSRETVKVICFSYGPRSMLRLAHRPGGIPDAIRRRDLSLVLLPLFVPAMFLACIRLAARVDVIHGNWSGPGLVGALAARLMGRPAVATLRGSDVDRAKRSLVFRWILRGCLSFNTRTVVVSEQMQRDLRQQFPRYARRIDFIPNGVTVGKIKGAGNFRAPVRLITISNLVTSKRVDVLLHALAATNLSSGLFLRIIGDGPERKRLEALAEKLDLSKRLEFTGQAPPDEIQHYLNWADIFVFASESEGRPNVILEAMAAGLPIVAADIPGTRELLLDSGVLVPPGDAEEFSRAISSYIDDPANALSIGRQARQSIAERGLTWEHAGARYATLYRELAKK